MPLLAQLWPSGSRTFQCPCAGHSVQLLEGVSAGSGAVFPCPRLGDRPKGSAVPGPGEQGLPQGRHRT